MHEQGTNVGIRLQPREIEIPADDPFKHDLLGRREAVDTLTHLVGNLEGPCVLAVDAAWGFGKTTFLRMWSQHLRNQGTPVVAFNAWETDFSEDPFLTLSTELTEGLQSDDTKLPNDTVKKLKDASQEVLRWVTPGAIRVAASQVPLVGTQLAEGAASFAEERLSRHSKARTSVKQFRRVLEDMAAGLSKANGNRPLMVMIDELDRCRPSYAVELLEVAKHLFSVDRIVFVLAVNSDQLVHSVKALYGNDFDAAGYLRRFFDVDVQLTEPDRQAFIHAQLQATGIYDYFDQVPKNPSSFYGIYFPKEVARKEAGETLQTMLFLLFGASNLSLRTVGQAIHRLGLLYASLRRDQDDFGLATTVALILRTMDPKLYGRFVAGAVSDLDVVDAVYERPGLKSLRHNDGAVAFEATIILAGLEDQISNEPRPETFRSPLLDRYRNWDRTDRELFENDETADSIQLAEAEHAKRVVSAVEQATQWGKGQIGFSHAVHRLELLSATLIDNQPDLSAENS